METASVSTGHPTERGIYSRTRDEHLRTPDFFNAAEFPTMTYRGTAAKWDGDAPAQIDGQLTLLGVTKPVTLTVTRWKCGPDPRTQGKRQMCGGNFTGSFKHSAFFIPVISDEVKLWIGMEAFKN
jgi:polyisoprenoid-binding protein YceI